MPDSPVEKLKAAIEKLPRWTTTVNLTGWSQDNTFPSPRTETTEHVSLLAVLALPEWALLAAQPPAEDDIALARQLAQVSGPCHDPMCAGCVADRAMAILEALTAARRL